MTKKSKPVKRQSILARALASSNQQLHVLDRFFSHLSAAEIRHSVALIKRHRHFVDAVELAASSLAAFARLTFIRAAR